MHRAGHRRQGPLVSLLAALAFLPGCGATTSEEALRLQGLAHRLAPLAPAGLSGEALRRLKQQVGAEAAASVAAAVALAQAVKPQAEPGASSVGLPLADASASLVALDPASSSLGPTGVGPSVGPEVGEPATTPLLASLPLGLPTQPQARSLALVGEGAAAGTWKALGRSAEALLDPKGYGARRPGAITTGQSLRLAEWRSPSLRVRLAAGEGHLRLVWATDGLLPEEHAIGGRLVASDAGREFTLPLGELGHKPGRLILVAKGEGALPLRVDSLQLEEGPAPMSPSLGQMASR